MRTTEELVRIASVGGGMTIPASRTTEELVRIASAGAGKGARIVITGAEGRTTEELVRIASVGKGAVQFDFGK